MYDLIVSIFPVRFKKKGAVSSSINPSFLLRGKNKGFNQSLPDGSEMASLNLKRRFLYCYNQHKGLGVFEVVLCL